MSQTLHCVEKKLGVVSIQVDDTGKIGVPGQCILIGEQTVMPRKTKDLKFSRVPFAFKDSTSSGSFRVRVSTLNQGAVFFNRIDGSRPDIAEFISKALHRTPTVTKGSK